MVQTIDVSRSANVEKIEQILEQENLANDESSPLSLRLPSKYEGGMLADIWAAILVGTACRHRPTRLVAWGFQHKIESNTAFALTPAFVVGLATAHEVGPERGEGLDMDGMRRHFALRNGGLADPDSGSAQTLLEFDPDFRIAPILRGESGSAVASPLVRKKLFQQTILRFRRRLEIGALRRGIEPVAAGPAGDVGRFLSELHENGYEHGARDGEGRVLSGTRFMRLRKHVANTKEQLVERCASLPELARHVEESVGAGGAVSLVEASISDFGLGIVDAFKRSPAATGVTLTRRELLESLIYDRLTSKGSDPAAGLGIQKALGAARRMQAFVSLRTAEFWLTASFADADVEVRMRDVRDRTHARVAGTHWQILWPQA